MAGSGYVWALVLAAGEGNRLRRLTTTAAGTAIPKQFCSLQGGPSLLLEALRRAEAFAARDRVCTVVARDHNRWWQAGLACLPPKNVIVQPENRGTGIGILLPLMHIMRRDPQARVVLLPSDHHVRDERKLACFIQKGIALLETHADELILLGVEPEDVDPDLGYILPGAVDACGVRKVDRFIEKPSAGAVPALIRGGALWNVFIVVIRAQALLDLFKRRYPDVVEAMHAAVANDASHAATGTATLELYRSLPTVDFSRDVAQGCESAMRVLRVPRCGWSDLGTPLRLQRTLRQLPKRPAAQGGALPPLCGLLDLSAQHAHLGAGG
jgi:mannose-1-phosphate guanylyltransferase